MESSVSYRFFEIACFGVVVPGASFLLGVLVSYKPIQVIRSRKQQSSTPSMKGTRSMQSRKCLSIIININEQGLYPMNTPPPPINLLYYLLLSKVIFSLANFMCLFMDNAFNNDMDGWCFLLQSGEEDA